MYVKKKKKRNLKISKEQRSFFVLFQKQSDKNVRSIFQKCSTIHNFQLALTPL